MCGLLGQDAPDDSVGQAGEIDDMHGVLHGVEGRRRQSWGTRRGAAMTGAHRKELIKYTLIGAQGCGNRAADVCTVNQTGFV
ncbi:hypothetical protein GCM10010376_33640 [Streptomyces violaceusniger]